jgi:superfamily II DNA or RNA helicase
MLAGEDPWRPGDQVLVRGRRWTLLERTAYSDCEALRLQPCDVGLPRPPQTLLTPFDRPHRIRRSRAIAVLRPKRWLHLVRELAAQAHPVGALHAAASSAIDLLPYQLEPALAMIRGGATRVMIADAVGLGKTIQAGLVLAELARHDGFRGLVIVPAGLREQWSRELAARFELEPVLADAAWLEGATRDLPAEINPWMLPGLYLSSYDFLKRPEVLHAIEHVGWDLVVVDEAHGASLGTARRAAAHALASRARRVLLLTATPHSGDDEQFDALCRIGEVSADSPPLVLFQRSRAAAGLPTGRRTVLLPVTPTREERRMHRMLDDYSSAVRRDAAARRDAHARLALIVLKKRALSSAGSLAASARKRLALLAEGPDATAEYQLTLPLFGEADDGAEDAPPDGVLALQGLDDPARERKWLSAIIAIADKASRGESKLRLLLRFLRRVREPVLVFTEFRDTLEDLYRATAGAGHDVRCLHGGLSPAERSSAVQGFIKAGGLLLATDAASEGLNLHHGEGHPGCRAVIHYELPWSPARLEQRTGRVDRLGQRRKVHEILLVAHDTAERLVLAPLVHRVAHAAAAAPFRSPLLDVLTDSRVATAVLDGQPLDLADAPRAPTRAVDRVAPPPPGLHLEASAEASRLVQQRAWRSLSRAPPRPRGIVATVGRLSDTPKPRLVCVYVLSAATRSGTTIYQDVVCVRMDRAGNLPPRSSAEVRRTVRGFMANEEPSVRAAVLAGQARVLDAATMLHREAVEQLARRDSTIAAPAASTARELVQVGLFDGRALKTLASRRRAAGTLLDESRARVAASASEGALETSVDLKAVLLARGRAR